MRFYCIADPGSSMGFRLAGVETAEVDDERGARQAFREFLGRRDAGVIIVTGAASGLLEGEIDAHRRRQDLPLVLEVPSSDGAGRVPAVEEFVRKALGVSI